jgi:hypothetical protein
MRITGEIARQMIAVRLDSFEQVNTGILTTVDDESGYVEWIDSVGRGHSVSLGPEAIRIIRKSSYGR